MKILVRVGQVVLALAVLAALAYPFRRDPIGPLAGKELTGEVVSEVPGDWSFTDEHFTIALEVRPEDPHSITTICFVHDGVLHVPAQGGGEKEWPSIVLADDRVRVKVGDRIYPMRATRVDESAFEPLFASAGRKYARLADAAASGDVPDDIWVFRLEPRAP